MRFDLGTLDSGERSLPFGLLVYCSSGVGRHPKDFHVSVAIRYVVSVESPSLFHHSMHP